MRLCISVDRALAEMVLISQPAKFREGHPTDISSLVGVCWYAVWGGVGTEMPRDGI